MKKTEFYKAVCAYLKGNATSWQEFILEDYYDSFKHCDDILEQFSNKKVSQIGRRILKEIDNNCRSLNEK